MNSLSIALGIAIGAAISIATAILALHMLYGVPISLQSLL